jgi:hypothetical protein
MTKDLFAGAFVGAGSTGFTVRSANGFFHRKRIEQKVAKETKVRANRRAKGQDESCDRRGDRTGPDLYKPSKDRLLRRRCPTGAQEEKEDVHRRPQRTQRGE